LPTRSRSISKDNAIAVANRAGNSRSVGLMREFAATSALGVGILHNPVVPGLLKSDPGLVDYVSITPDIFWTDCGPGANRRFVELDSWIEFIEWAALRFPLVAHSVGLSLGSMEFSDDAYVEQLADWHRRYRFLWHSDHLSFAQVRSAFGHEQHAGMAVPLPYDFDVLGLLTARIQALAPHIPSPFLVENAVVYMTFSDQDMTEPKFLNALVRDSGCALLLDLHNLYTNARNHKFDASAFLRELDLNAVVEVHIAGGGEFAGMYTDSHAGPCPEPVWALHEEIMPRTPNLKGVTFEFHDSYFPAFGADGVRAQLQRAKAVWSRYRSQ
jgi:uncharacterized protein